MRIKKEAGWEREEGTTNDIGLKHEEATEEWLKNNNIPYIREYYMRSNAYDFVIFPCEELWVKQPIIIECKAGEQSNISSGIRQLKRYLEYERMPVGWLVLNNNIPNRVFQEGNITIYIFGSLHQMKIWLIAQPKFRDINNI